MKSWKRTIFMILALLTILSLILSSCKLIDNGNGDGDHDEKGDRKDNGDPDTNKEDKSTEANKITICHKTGSAKNPYVEITVSYDSITDGHGTHEGDIIPAPESGCPTE